MSAPRVPSGVDRLDAVLGGGLVAHGLYVLVGIPGTGKTMLAQQYLFRNATVERPGVFVSTVSEPLEKILRYGDLLAYFDRSAIGSSVFYHDLAQVLTQEGLNGFLDAIDELLRKHRPGILVIDSFKALHAYADDGAGDFRVFLYGLASRLTAMPTTVILVGEYTADRIARDPEFAVADGIVVLGPVHSGGRQRRVLRVAKLRGSDFLTGDHSYRISAAGLDVFPRLADPVDVESFDLSAHKVGSGVGILDEMLGDGFWRGSSTLAVGPSGAGKTVLGLHFLFAGAGRGERGVLASFQEDPAQLERICRGFGWSTGGEGVDVVYRSPIDLEIDEWVYDLLERVARTSADRLVIDSLAELERSAQDEIRFREYLYSLLQRLSRMGVSVMMTLGTPDYYDVNRLSRSGLSPIADNVVLLQFEREDSRIGRSITVLKTTAAVHNAMVRRYQITAEGFRLDGAAASGS